MDQFHRPPQTYAPPAGYSHNGMLQQGAPMIYQQPYYNQPIAPMMGVGMSMGMAPPVISSQPFMAPPPMMGMGMPYMQPQPVMGMPYPTPMMGNTQTSTGLQVPFTTNVHF